MAQIKRGRVKPDLNSILPENDLSYLKRHGYKFLTYISQGAFGMVFRGKCWSKVVAVKYISFTGRKIAKPESVVPEIDYMGCKHPHIIDIVDFYMIGRSGCLFFMEFAEGGELRDIMNQNKTGMDETRVCRFYNQIADAMAYLHSRGVVHRDLKPENILLDKTRSICKIADFGLAKVFYNIFSGQKYYNEYFGGTYFYMSPESLRVYNHMATPTNIERCLASSADVWSVGVILFEMTYGNAYPWENLRRDVNFLVYDLVREQESQNIVWPNRVFVRDTKRFISRHFELDFISRATMEDLLADVWTNLDHKNPMIDLTMEAQK